MSVGWTLLQWMCKIAQCRTDPQKPCNIWIYAPFAILLHPWSAQYISFFLFSLQLDHVKPEVIIVTYRHVAVIILPLKLPDYYSVIYTEPYNLITAMHYSVNTVKLIKKVSEHLVSFRGYKKFIHSRLRRTTNLGKCVNCVENRDIINTFSSSCTTFSLAQQPVWIWFPKTLS